MHFLPGIVARPVVLAGLLAVGWGCSDSYAQGSTGGQIGKTDKSLSGPVTVEPERPLPNSPKENKLTSTRKSATRPKPAREGGASVSRFDGTWTFIATGCGAGTKQGTVSGGRLTIGDGGGTVSASGAMRVSFTTLSGVTQVAVGQLSGATGAGTYSRPNGCAGSWTARKAN